MKRCRVCSVMRKFLSFREVGDLYGVHPDTVRRWAREGRIDVHRVGPRMVRIDREHAYQRLGRPLDPA